MVGTEYGSLTKEPPLATLDATIRAITPGMSYEALLAYAREATHRDAPGLITKRFLRVERDGSIAYDYFLSLLSTNPLESPFIRKIMYFLWAYRDDRIRRFVCERVANQNGLWRVSQLLNKANSNFFEEWLQPSTARKARSNFEYFLVEASLYNLQTRAVHLELDDGWVAHAAMAAAQHERDPVLREELLANPIAFLERRGWIGLLNARRASVPTTSPLLIADALPLEDAVINTTPAAAQISSEWQPRNVATSGRKSATVDIDLVARERANASHYMLEEVLVRFAKVQAFLPKRNQNIDIYFETAAGTVLAEIKSCTDGNFHAQVRKAISQLFEYRFLYQDLLGSTIIMLLLMETAPPHEKRWLVDYTRSLGITLAWYEASTSAIATTGEPPLSLSTILIAQP